MLAGSLFLFEIAFLSTQIGLLQQIKGGFFSCFSSFSGFSDCILLFTGEALGAIGNTEVLDLLKQYSEDPVIEVIVTNCKVWISSAHLSWD